MQNQVGRGIALNSPGYLIHAPHNLLELGRAIHECTATTLWDTETLMTSRETDTAYRHPHIAKLPATQLNVFHVQMGKLRHKASRAGSRAEPTPTPGSRAEQPSPSYRQGRWGSPH